jgi:hypothetical protein
LPDDSFRIYPNRAGSSLIIQSSLKGQASIEITDILGRIVMQTKLLSGENKFDISDLHYGVYLVKINCLNGDNKVVRKIIKE